jgi:hypothetical protein
MKKDWLGWNLTAWSGIVLLTGASNVTYPSSFTHSHLNWRFAHMARSTHINVLTTLAAAAFIATQEQVKELASFVQHGAESDGTYFKVVLAHTMAKLAKRGRRSAKSQLEALDNVHADLYPAVLEGVGPTELESAERTRRAKFASSSASTVRRFIKLGGDVRNVDLATVTKTGLLASVLPKVERKEGESRIERSFNRAEAALMDSANKLMARGDPDEARERVEQVMAALEKLLDNPPAREERKAKKPAARITATNLVRTPVSQAPRENQVHARH